MDRRVYDPWDKVRRFCGPVRKHPVWMLVCTAIIWAVSYFGTALGELSKRNNDDMLMLGGEMLCESGYDFTDSAKHHTDMLNTYVEHMEGRYLAPLMRMFFSPKKGLHDALKTLRSCKGNQREDARAIWRAGEQVMQFRRKQAVWWPRVGIVLHADVKVSGQLLYDSSIAVGQSERALMQFEQNRSLESALVVCERDRRTMLLFFLARWSASTQEDLFDRFQKVVETAAKRKKERASEFPEHSPERKLLTIFARSEERRLGILRAIREGDMQQARDLMWEAIEVAYRMRPTVLQICSQLGFGKKVKDIA